MKQTQPYPKEEFAWAKWGPKEILQNAKEVLREKKVAYEKIKKIPAKDRTFENTIYAIEASSCRLDDIGSQIGLLSEVSPDKKIREAAVKTVKLVDETIVDIEYDPAMYRAVKEFVAKKEKVTGPDAKLLKDMIRDYRRMGFDLSLAKQHQLKQIIKEIQKKETDFGININDYQGQIEVTLQELTGMSDNFIDRLKRTKNGKYIVSVSRVDFIPFVENAQNALKRKALTDVYFQKGGQKNLALLKSLIKLRNQRARLLGYAHHGDYRTEDRMAKNTKTVMSFLQQTMKKLTPGVVRDIQELTSLKRKMTGDSKVKLEYFDTAFYISESQKLRHAIDNEKVREYFPMKTVTKGMFEIYEKLLSVRFERTHNYSSWHEDVEHYLVRDKSGFMLGHFLFDLYPREGKYSHAGIFQIKRSRTAGYKSPVRDMGYCVMAANFPRPTKDTPSLLNHDEVRTLFHEFGHIMHGILSTAPYRSQSGTSVSRDFVEAPSQMLENWIWDAKMLMRMSGHYQTKKPFPADFLKNLIASKQHMVAYLSMRQFIYALFDMLIHTKKGADVLKTYNQLVKKFIFIAMLPTNIYAAGFGHLVGYDAGYYSYMWSKVYSCDMFTRFKKEGLLNTKTGRDYRTWILEKGSSVEELDLVKGFLGRTPNNKAFLEEIGLG